MYWFRNLAGTGKRHPEGRRRFAEKLKIEQLGERVLPSFLAGLSFDAGANPAFVTTGDFNGDGILDLAVGGTSGVSVLLNNGGGIFQAPREVGPVTFVNSIAVGDFNGDGILDLATSNISADQVSVLLGNGDGSFQPARTFAAGGGSYSLAAGDFNGDGIQDLAVTNYNITGGGTVSVLLGNGDGSFQAPHTFAVGKLPWRVAVGDFNGDGIPDLVVVDNGSTDNVAVLLGNGDGSFQPAVQYTAGSATRAVVIADLNGDGFLDLAVAAGNGVSVFLGNGDGSLQPAWSVPTGRNSPRSVAVADFNGDGIPDLAVATNGVDEADVLLGNGDGSFQPPYSFTVGEGPDWVTVGDLNGDGIQDFAVVNVGSEDVSVLLGNGDGSFPGAPAYDAGTGPRSMAMGDFNGDGIPDLAIADTGDAINNGQDVSVLLGNGDGSFQDPRTFDSEIFPGAIGAGDFNGDGILDLAVAGSDHVSVLLGNGDGSFQAPRIFAVGMTADSLVIADFNGDGIPDLAVADAGDSDAHESGVNVLLGNGDGSFQDPLFIAAGTVPESIVTADFNGDGVPDLTVVDIGDRFGNGQGVSVLLGNGDGTFQPASALAGGRAPWAMAVGDYNGDGALDLAITNYDGVSVLLGNGDGTFRSAGSFTTANSPQQAVVAGDFNGDGILDLAVTGWAGVKVLLGNGDGSFQTTPISYRTKAYPQTLVVGDFNDDRTPDLAVAIRYANEVTILLNDGVWPPGGAPHRRPPTEDPVHRARATGWPFIDLPAVQTPKCLSRTSTQLPNQLSAIPIASASGGTEIQRSDILAVPLVGEERTRLLRFDLFRTDPDGPAFLLEPVAELNRDE